MTTDTTTPSLTETHASVLDAQEGLVTIRIDSGTVRMNEVGYIVSGAVRLKGEVLRIRGDRADMQVYEDTAGVKVGDPVEMSGELLSVELGPGLLGRVFDGLQNPLEQLAREDGFFLKRGKEVAALDRQKRWEFFPAKKIGDTVVASEVLGETKEGRFSHKVMAPFDLPGTARIVDLESGIFRLRDPLARLVLEDGSERVVTMGRSWPMRRPLAEHALKTSACHRRYPDEPMITSQRLIDTFFPVAKGGTACIPGPFGAGKTVLQQLIARYAEVDIVIIVACGERAGEVVETLTEYPQLEDPRGGSLMERTIIICNTSSMPVAARELSMYTGVTVGEYYRQMGLDVLLIADSTSRWAQAMREISGRLEEIPGEEAFPAYLESTIKQMYERGGVIEGRDGETGSLTMIGTISPAGGNFEEPVTQATLATVKSFLGLSSERAYRRAYPAIDPLISWSRYLDQLAPWYESHLGSHWVAAVKKLLALLDEGEEIAQMMKVTGEEGVTLENFVTWQKAQLVDMVYLQQDAFDAVDASAPLSRQQQSFALLETIVDASLEFTSRQEAQGFFTKLTGLYKNLNYSAAESDAYRRYRQEIEALLKEKL